MPTLDNRTVSAELKPSLTDIVRYIFKIVVCAVALIQLQQHSLRRIQILAASLTLHFNLSLTFTPFLLTAPAHFQ